MRRNPVRCGAFSLLEIMLVLVIVGVVAALAVPAMNAAFATYEVRQAAQRIRTRIIEARRRAVERGVPYAFVYVEGGRQHGFAACQSLADLFTLPGATPVLPDAVRRNPYDAHLFELEEGFQIAAGSLTSQGEEATRPQITGADPLLLLLTPEERLTELAGSPWLTEALRATGIDRYGSANGIVWQPDGTTTGLELTIVGPHGFAVSLTVDGVTGRVKLGEVQKVSGGEQIAPSQPRLPGFDRRLQ